MTTTFIFNYVYQPFDNQYTFQLVCIWTIGSLKQETLNVFFLNMDTRGVQYMCVFFLKVPL